MVRFSRDATDYLVSRPGTPFDRFDIFEDGLYALIGSSHLAPVREPRRILDVGTALTPWLGRITVDFPAAFTVGAGIDPTNGRPLPAGVAVRADLDSDLPFLDGSFDYLHHRVLALPLRDRDTVWRTEKLVRMLAPGGWIEVVITEAAMVPVSPTTALLGRQVLRLLNMDPDHRQRAQPLDEVFRQHGLVDIGRQGFELPIGSWGGPLGMAILSNYRAIMGWVASALEAKLGVPTLDTLWLVARSTEEIEQTRTVVPVWAIWGRRPV